MKNYLINYLKLLKNTLFNESKYSRINKEIVFKKTKCINLDKLDSSNKINNSYNKSMIIININKEYINMNKLDLFDLYNNCNIIIDGYYKNFYKLEKEEINNLELFNKYIISNKLINSYEFYIYKSFVIELKNKCESFNDITKMSRDYENYLLVNYPYYQNKYKSDKIIKINKYLFDNVYVIISEYTKNK